MWLDYAAGCDAEGRLVAVKARIVGDNGASAEGGLEGTFSEIASLMGVQLGLQSSIERIDEIGGPSSEPHVPVGWAWAMNTPFQWAKQIASHLGGVRNPIAVSWPARIKDRGGVRAQFHHVIDIAPTIYDAVGVPYPDTLNGVAQKPLDGVSMVYTFDSATAPGQRRTQYFEMFINRGLYHDGWWAASRTGIPWESSPTPANPDTATWELYNIDEDWSQAVDLAATGKTLWETVRVEGVNNIYASPIAAGGHVYLTDRRGTIAVVADAPVLKVIATNDMGEGVDATPAAAGNQLFVRGERHLFCLGSP